MNNISDDLKKVFLAGIGAVAVTAEKSKELLEELIKKGELTLEQGKILNEELKRNIQTKNGTDDTGTSSIISQLDKMNKEEIAALKAKLAELERTDTDGENNK